MGYWRTLGKSVFSTWIPPHRVTFSYFGGSQEDTSGRGIILGIFELPKESPSNSVPIAYWLNKNISSHVAINQPRATIDNNTKGRFRTIWNLEEQDCTLLIHNVLKRNSMTYLFCADLEHKSPSCRRISNSPYQMTFNLIQWVVCKEDVLVIVWFLLHRAL